MNLVVAALLDVHAKIAAENRGEQQQPEANRALRTEVKNGRSEDTNEVRVQDKQGQR